MGSEGEWREGERVNLYKALYFPLYISYHTCMYIQLHHNIIKRKEVEKGCGLLVYLCIPHVQLAPLKLFCGKKKKFMKFAKVFSFESLQVYSQYTTLNEFT